MFYGESTYGNNSSSDFANEGICPSVVLRNHAQARRAAVHRVKLGVCRKTGHYTLIYMIMEIRDVSSYQYKE